MSTTPRRGPFFRRFAAAVTAGLLAAAALASTAAPAHSAPLTREAEPNNSMAQANALTPGVALSGTASSDDYYDSDYYRVSIPKGAYAGSKLGLKFTFPAGLGTGRQYDVVVSNAAGDELFDFALDGSDSNGAWLAAQSMYLPAGDYFVEIYASTGQESFGKQYSLTALLTPGNVELETNGSTSKATSLLPGKSYLGASLGTDYYDVDYFACTARSSGQLKVGFTFAQNLGTEEQYELGVYDARGNILFRYELDGSDADGKWLATQSMFVPAGNYYVRVVGYDSSASWGKPYSLRADAVSMASEQESNNDSAHATPMVLGKSYAGSGNAELGGWDTDLFRLSGLSAGAYSVNFTFPSGLGTDDLYELTLLDASGRELSSFDLTGADAKGTALAQLPLKLPKGTVYLRVDTPYYSDAYGETYRVKVIHAFSATPVPVVKGQARYATPVTASAGKWGPAASLAYQWKRDGKVIKGATQQKYTPTASDVNHRLSVTVTGTKSGYRTVSKTSASVKVAWKVLTRQPTPSITGTPKLGGVLKVKPGTWAPAKVSLKYQWKRGGKPIKGATKSSYKLVKADERRKITVTVTGSKYGFVSVSKTSKSVLAKK